jgi:hypothetical protein
LYCPESTIALFPGTTIKNIETYISLFFKNASDRDGGRTKRKNVTDVPANGDAAPVVGGAAPIVGGATRYASDDGGDVLSDIDDGSLSEESDM